MPTQQTSQEFNFYAYVDSLYEKLPQELKTAKMYSDLAHQANDIIMGIIGDSMNKEDMENLMEQSAEKIDLDELIVDYLERNPEVIDDIMRELTNLENIVTHFSQL